MTKFLVTGASGFVGANFVRKLVSDENEITVFLRKNSNLWRIQDIIPKTFKEAGITNSSINIYCATCGPGLIGGLLVGSTVAKSMAAGSNKPFYPINHLEGHALSVQINNEVSFPFILLLITGGHTQLYLVKKIGSYDLLGTTIDDSVGEIYFNKAICLDKLGKHGAATMYFRAARANANGNIKILKSEILKSFHQSIFTPLVCVDFD